ncbi:MAG: uL13 family ribosomal protein [Patescibacteria group bacterium UBA2103]
MEVREYTIDATDRPIGRVATEAATYLMGKNMPDFTKHEVAPVSVTIENVEKLKISEKKRGQKEYQKYTGYPGGLRISSLQDLIDKKGYEEVMRKAIYGMLPGNKLRPRMMKRLTFSK